MLTISIGSAVVSNVFMGLVMVYTYIYIQSAIFVMGFSKFNENGHQCGCTYVCTINAFHNIIAYVYKVHVYTSTRKQDIMCDFMCS